MAWQEYGACPVTVGIDAPPPARPAGVPEGAWVAHVDDAPAGAVRVDRGTEWGNPFKIGRDGTRLEVIRKHQAWLRSNPDLMARLPELRGKTLTCHCYPSPCHAETLSKWANDPDSIPPVIDAAAPIPTPTGMARVWRPADDAPIRIMVTGSRKWDDNQRIEDALSWAVRNARTTYPGRRIELVHGGAAGADTLANDIWTRNRLGAVDAHPINRREWDVEGRGAGHKRNKRMVSTLPHVVLAFDKDGSPGTASAIRMSREMGLPVYVFHDTQGIPSHTAYPGRPADKPTTALTDATEPTYQMYEQDPDILGYYNPTIPFRGINRELQARLVSPTGKPHKIEKITTLEQYEERVAQHAQAAVPDWSRIGDEQPGIDEYDPPSPAYTIDEADIADDLWAEEMDVYLTSLSARRRSQNKDMYDYQMMATLDGPQVAEYGAQLATRIDGWLRARRDGGTPRQVDEMVLRKTARRIFTKRTGRNIDDNPNDPTDRALYEDIKAKVQGRDAAVRAMTETEQARQKDDYWKRWADRGAAGDRVARSRRWKVMKPEERKREIASARARGHRIDPDTGKIEYDVYPKAGQRTLETRMVRGEDGVERPMQDWVPDPNERVYTDWEDVPDRQPWRDPLDSDKRISSDEELDVLARDQYEMDIDSQTDELYRKRYGEEPDTVGLDEEQAGVVETRLNDIKAELRGSLADQQAAIRGIKADLAAQQKENALTPQQETGSYIGPGRGITQENIGPRNAEPYVDPTSPDAVSVSELTQRQRNVPDTKPKKQVSAGAQQLIAKAMDYWPVGVDKPKVIYPDRPGLDAYSARDAEALRSIIVFYILKPTGGLG